MKSTFALIVLLCFFALSACGDSGGGNPNPGQVPIPVFSPAPGSFQADIPVTITCPDPGARIYYSVNGQNRGEYFGDVIPVSDDASPTTITAVARKDGMDDSDTATAVYTISPNQVSPVQGDPPAGIYNGNQYVTLSTATPGSTIFYKLNGIDMGKYIGPIPIENNNTNVLINAVAKKDGWGDSQEFSGRYVINFDRVSTPVFAPMPSSGDTYKSETDFNVTITCDTPGAEIYYFINDAFSGKYLAPIPVTAFSGAMVIRAYAQKTGMNDSTMRTLTYLVDDNKVKSPTFDPRPGGYPDPKTITLSCETAGALIRYCVMYPGDTEETWLDFTAPFMLSAKDVQITVKARASKPGMNDSDETAALYTISDYYRVATPAFSPVPGAYDSDLLVTLSCANGDAAIRYNINSPSDPDLDYPSEGISLSGAGTYVIKTMASNGSLYDSYIGTGSYTVSYNPDAAPVFDPAPGECVFGQEVQLSCVSPDYEIWYRVGLSGDYTRYTEATVIIVEGDMTLSAFSKKTGNGMRSSITVEGDYSLLP